MLQALSEKESQEYHEKIENWWDNLDEQFKFDIHRFFTCSIEREYHKFNFPLLCKFDKNNFCKICFRKMKNEILYIWRVEEH